jgi:hypothetical protein
MSVPNKRTVRRALKDLRTLIDNNDDPAVQRIAYGMETVIRWVTEDTVGWPSPAREAKILAKMLREEMASPSTTVKVR